MITRFRSNYKDIVEEGRKAANAGRRTQSLLSIIDLLSMAFGALDTIIDNQAQLEAAINKPAPAGNGQVLGQRRP